MEFINVQENPQPVIQTNSQLGRETNKIFSETISYIVNTTNKLEYVNVEEIIKKLQNVIVYSNEYNANLKNWFDEKFVSDREKLFNILDQYDESLNIFGECDKISCTNEKN
jgi:hypothetical protein